MPGTNAMQTLHLDYQRRFRPFPTLGGVLLVGALVLTLLTGRQYLYFAQLLASLEERADKVERIARPTDVTLKASPQDKEKVAREVTRANEVLRRITLPWDELFRAVESASPKNVALLATDPDPDKQVLKIVGEAKDVASLLEYMHNLEANPMFQMVTLQSHQIQQQDPQRPIRFSLVANWKDRR